MRILRKQISVESSDKMSILEFEALCGEALVDPALAIENDNIVRALRDKDDAEVKRLIEEEF